MGEAASLDEVLSEVLSSIVEKEEDVVVLDADSSRACGTDGLAKSHPKKFFQLGIAQQDLFGTAAGLALDGKLPFVSSFAAFIPRALEQIRNSVARESLPLRIIGVSAGFSLAREGTPLHCFEDLAIFRSLPNLQVYSPADGRELEAILRHLSKHRKKPAYIRLGSSPKKELVPEDYEFKEGEPLCLRKGKDLCIFSTGIMVERALEAAELLQDDGIQAQIISLSTLKEYNEEAIVEYAKESGIVLTAEEHSVIGGLGSLVASTLARRFPCPMDMIGTSDCFTPSGEEKDLVKSHGLNPRSIFERSKRLLGQ